MTADVGEIRTLPKASELQVMLPWPLQLNVKVSVAVPVFVTVNVTPKLNAFGRRIRSSPLSGVTLAPYETTGTENVPLSLPTPPVAVRVSVPVPVAPTL